MSFKLTMMTSSNGNIFRVTGPLCGEFTGPGEFLTQSPVTRSFDVYFDLRLNKRLNKQSRGWWFETLSRPFWRHRNGVYEVIVLYALSLFAHRDEPPICSTETISWFRWQSKMHWYQVLHWRQMDFHWANHWKPRLAMMPNMLSHGRQYV